MTINARAAAFLENVAKQEAPIKIEAFSAPRNTTRMGQKFINALRICVPALVLTASAHAQTATPGVTFTIDGKSAPMESAYSVAQSIMTQLASEDHSPRAEQIVQCFQEKIVDAGLSRTEKGFAAVMLRAKAPSIISEMDEHAKEHGTNPDLMVAAFCANPLNWKAQLNQWERKADRLTELARSGSAETLVQYQAHESLERYAAQSATLYRAMQNAAYHQSNGQFDRSLMRPVGASDWIGAITSIASGVADMTGSRDARDTVRSARSTARRGESISRRVGDLGRYEGARKWDQVGRIIGEVGRTVDLGEVIKRMKPR